MTIMTADVGPNGANLIQDITLVQAMLQAITRPDGRRYYNTNYDGRFGPMTAVAPGWKLRVLLAQALFSDPDVLLLALAQHLAAAEITDLGAGISDADVAALDVPVDDAARVHEMQPQ